MLGAAVAFTGATLMAHSRFLERTLLPIAILVKVTPIVAVAPLFVIWFGFGSLPKIFIASLITFFPVLVNAMVGLRAVNPGALDFFRSLHASRTETYLKLRLPSSLPYLFAAFRISIPLSVIGAVVGEWFSGDRGLGSVIIRRAQQPRHAHAVFGDTGACVHRHRPNRHHRLHRAQSAILARLHNGSMTRQSPIES